MEITEILSAVFTLTNILAIVAGSLIGMLFGAIPGLGAMVTVTLMLPVSFMLPPLPAVLMLLSIYQSSEYGGSISSILLGIPGTPSNVATILDGHPLALNEGPGKALSYSLVSSTIGGLVSGLVLVTLAKPIADFALTLSYSEYFLVALLGIFAVAIISSENMTKSVISGILGIMAGTVGIDLLTGEPRFTFNRIELMEGMDLIPVILGLFAFTEVASMIKDNLRNQGRNQEVSTTTRLTFKEYKSIGKATSIGSIVGTLVGIFPGTGSSTSSWFGYSLAKKASKNPETFGTGNPEGIAGAESANNSAVGGAVLPLLALGVPGSPTIAIIMGAFIIHGIVPGPHVFSQEPLLTYGILYGFLLTCIAMYLSGRLFTPLFAYVLKTPMYLLIPAVLLISIIGVYAANYLFFEVWLAIGVGVLAFYMKSFGYSLPAFVLAFVLSDIMELNFRRALLAYDGSLSFLVTRPYSLALVLIMVAIFAFNFIKQVRRKKAISKY